MTIAARLRFGMTIAGLLGSSLCYAGLHPIHLDESSNCLECHADHATGDHVHPAVKQGCTSCHNVESREDGSYVVLKSATSVICAECHQPLAFVNQHFPYTSGMCIRCHNPHSSVNLHLLRTKVNELCLDCHLVHAKGAASPYLPLIALTSNNRIGHPYGRHPVSGTPDPLTGSEMSCISCHLAHGSTKAHLLKMGSEIPEDALNQNTETNDMCRKCHMRLWGVADVSGKKKNKKSKREAN